MSIRAAKIHGKLLHKKVKTYFQELEGFHALVEPHITSILRHYLGMRWHHSKSSMIEVTGGMESSSRSTTSGVTRREKGCGVLEGGWREFPYRRGGIGLCARGLELDDSLGPREGSTAIAIWGLFFFSLSSDQEP